MSWLCITDCCVSSIQGQVILEAERAWEKAFYVHFWSIHVFYSFETTVSIHQLWQWEHAICIKESGKDKCLWKRKARQEVLTKCKLWYVSILKISETFQYSFSAISIQWYQLRVLALSLQRQIATPASSYSLRLDNACIAHNFPHSHRFCTHIKSTSRTDLHKWLKMSLSPSIQVNTVRFWIVNGEKTHVV